MLRKPIFEVDNFNVIIKNEEEKLGHEDINNEVNSSKHDSKEDIKTIEAQTTKQTNTDDFSKNKLQNIDLKRFNYFQFPFNFFAKGAFLNIVKEEEKEKEENEITEIKEKKRGRKAEKTDTNSPHNKFADDNLRKKSKHIVLSEILNFLNSKLKEIYKDNIGNGILLKQLLTLNHKQKANIIVEENKQFLQKTLQEIFSDEISKRYTNFPPDHNKNLINRLLEEDDEEKRKYFNNLFKLTFSQVLYHFQGKQIIKELVGLRTYKEALRNYENEKDYYENLKYHLTNFEEIIKSKKSRKPRKNKKVEDINEKILE